MCVWFILGIVPLETPSVCGWNGNINHSLLYANEECESKAHVMYATKQTFGLLCFYLNLFSMEFSNDTRILVNAQMKNTPTLMNLSHSF